jgi:WD40 repeat protein
MISHQTKVWTSSGDGSIQIWDPVSGAELRTLRGHQGKVCALLSVGKQVWSAGKDKHILIWDASTYTLVGELEVPMESVKALCLVRREVRFLVSCQVCAMFL